MAFYKYAPYVSVGDQKQNALRIIERLNKKGQTVQPITIEGNKIATSFWGKAWCTHLETFADDSGRLARGRACVRHGLVIHFAVKNGYINAMVSGSEVYTIEVRFTPLPAPQWQLLKKACTGQIGSMIELLQGTFSKELMQIIASPAHGLFPSEKEIDFKCSCPDGAYMCKHIAGTLYGLAAQLDSQPELLFTLRNVNPQELFADLNLSQQVVANTLDGQDLSALFGIDVDDGAAAVEPPAPLKAKLGRPRKNKE